MAGARPAEELVGLEGWGEVGGPHSGAVSQERVALRVVQFLDVPLLWSVLTRGCRRRRNSPKVNVWWKIQGVRVVGLIEFEDSYSVRCVR